jgi:hypothetical protein
MIIMGDWKTGRLEHHAIRCAYETTIKNERSSNGFVFMIICVAFYSVVMPNQSRNALLLVV